MPFWHLELPCRVDKQVFVIRIKVHLGFSIWAFAFRLYCRTRKVLRLSRKTLSRVKNELNNISLDNVANIYDNWTFYSTSRICTWSPCKRKRKRYKYFNWSGLNVRHQLKYSRKCGVIITYTSRSNSKKFHNHENWNKRDFLYSNITILIYIQYIVFLYFVS